MKYEEFCSKYLIIRLNDLNNLGKTYSRPRIIFAKLSDYNVNCQFFLLLIWIKILLKTVIFIIVFVMKRYL